MTEILGTPLRWIPVGLAVVVVVGLGLPSVPTWADVTLKQVSVTGRGGDPKGYSLQAAISADGRYVAFHSYSGDLVPGDHTIHWEDVFVRDTATSTTVRASVDVDGGDPNDESTNPAISLDGRYVTFESDASDLVPGDGNGLSDVFVRDLLEGTTARASVDVHGGDPNDDSFGAAISADGRYVLFSSSASDLVKEGGNGFSDVFVRDLIAGTTIRASLNTGGADPNGSSYRPSISADGRYVAFYSSATDLIQGDGNSFTDIFVRDLVAGTTVRASVDPEGGDPNETSYQPTISSDGRYVAFWSFASNLVAGDGNGYSDVFVRDLVAGATIRVSVDMRGGEPNDDSVYAAISADGRHVAFGSNASDLVEGDGNGDTDVFVRDLLAGTIVRVSVDTEGGDPFGFSCCPSISGDGRFVAFHSEAPNLVAGRGDRQWDVFVARWS